MYYKYKKRLCITICLIFASLFLCSCQSTSSEEEYLENFLFNEVNTYQLDVFIDGTEIFGKPQAILCGEDALFFADREKDCIYKYNYNGELLKTIGTTGNGTGEFLEPIVMAIDNNGSLYVGENGNRRIQEIDEEGNFIQSFELEDLKKDKSSILMDMETDADNTIFLTVRSYSEKLSQLYQIKEGKVSKTGKKISGVLGSDTTKELILYLQSNRWEDGNIYSATGYIGRIQNGVIEKMAKLPSLYYASDVVIYDGFMYAYSKAYATLDKFTLDGEYIETIFSQEANQRIELNYLAVDSKGNFYMSGEENKMIYQIRKK